MRVGISAARILSLRAESFEYPQIGPTHALPGKAEDTTFKRLRSELDPNAPCFLIVSPDIKRQYVDENIPQIIFVQPSYEIIFSPNRVNGEISYACDSSTEKQAVLMLQDSLRSLPDSASDAKHLLRELPPVSEPPPFSHVARDWVPAEGDEEFLERLDRAIRILADFPDGKMCLTRGYERRLSDSQEPFELYELHARMNGDYACSHFYCIGDGQFSLGCSPESVFEINQDTLTVDVVAATCRSSENSKYLDAELLNNPKQVKEHMGSLTNRKDRYSPFCEADSIRSTSEMQVKRLRNVFHLHSIFTGRLLPEITMFELLETIFPLLGARPKELLPFTDTETAPHRYYGGIIGHTYSGAASCFLNLRSALLSGGVLHAKVGAGVIMESDSYKELMETQDKISGLMEAVDLWQRRSVR